MKIRFKLFNILQLAVAGSLLASTTVPASANDDFPSKPARIIVPFPPGGFNDVLARTLAQKLSVMWKQPVIADNRPGGNTILGNNIAAKSAPDGYTLLVTPLTFSVMPALYPGKLPYDAVKDFSPVIWAGSTQNVIVVRNNLPISSVAELIAYAKANPGKLNYGTAGSGTSHHLSVTLFESMTGTKLTHIPYKGSGPALMGALGGEVDLLFDNLPNVLTYIRAGQLRPLAVSGAKRASQLPDVPTVSESGVPGYEVNIWYGVQMPGNTPKPIVRRANQDINTILKESDVVKVFGDQGVSVVGGPPEVFEKLLSTEIPKWKKVVLDSGMKIE